MSINIKLTMYMDKFILGTSPCIFLQHQQNAQQSFQNSTRKKSFNSINLIRPLTNESALKKNIYSMTKPNHQYLFILVRSYFIKYVYKFTFKSFASIFAFLMLLCVFYIIMFTLKGVKIQLFGIRRITAVTCPTGEVKIFP